MENSLAMRCGQSVGELMSDQRSFILFTPAAVEAVRKRLAIEKLHGEKAHFAEIGAGGVNVIHQASVRMAYVERAFQLAGKKVVVSRLGAFDGDALFAGAVKRFIDDAHGAIAHAPENFKATSNGLAGFKDLLQGIDINEFNQRAREEIAHALFPGDDLGNFVVEIGIALAGGLEKAVALAAGRFQRIGRKTHHAIVTLC